MHLPENTVFDLPLCIAGVQRCRGGSFVGLNISTNTDALFRRSRWQHAGRFRSPVSVLDLRLGFTLIEMLVVMAIIIVMTGLAIPAFTSIKSATDLTAAVSSIASTLESARTYALANSTYVWVGFYEDDESQASPNIVASANGGRIILSVVASKDGTRYLDGTTAPAAFGAGQSSNPVALAQLNKLVKMDNVHLIAADIPGATPSPVRPSVPYAYQLGDSSGAATNNSAGAFAQNTLSQGDNITTFTYPIPLSASQAAPAPQYTFTKIIEFNPQGEASKITENTYGGAGAQSFIEVAIQPTHGDTVDPHYANTTNPAAAVQVEGMTGQLKIYRP